MARTGSKWQTILGGTAIQTISPAGYDILINGTSKYLNFNTTVGSSGYGFRDNAGVMEFKDSGGAWAAFGTGGGGTPGGSTTQLQYNNAGAFGGISGATTNGTAVTFTAGNLIGADIKSSSSAGIKIISHSGTDVGLFGAGGGAGATFYGGVIATNFNAGTTTGTGRINLPDAGTTSADGISFGAGVARSIFGNASLGISLFSGSGTWAFNSAVLVLPTNQASTIRMTPVRNFQIDNGTQNIFGINGTSYQTSLTPPSLTGSSATSALSVTQTWNTSGNPTAILVNITNTASGATSNIFDFQIGGTSQLVLTKAGNLGVGIAPTAYLHLKAGTATANTAPLKFTTGTLNTTPEAGAFEYNNTPHFTNSDATRRNIVLSDGTYTPGLVVVGGKVKIRVGGTDYNVLVE